MFVLVLPFCLNSQNDDKKWELGFVNNYQHRLNSVNKSYISTRDDEGSRKLGLYANRRVMKQGKSELRLGFTASHEFILNLVEYNHCGKSDFCTFVLIMQGGSYKSFFEPTLDYRYEVLPKLKGYLGVNGLMNIYQNWNEDLNGTYLFQFNGFQSFAGLRYEINRMNLGIDYRVLNYQIIDPFIALNSTFRKGKPNYYDKEFHFHNPTELRFSVAYRL